MKNTTVLKSSFFILFLCFTFFSCNRDSIVGTLETEELFSLNYGSFEDEFNLYTSNPEDYFSAIAMQDGFFYISDSASKKVSQFSSYGDLLSIIYNPETKFKKIIASLFDKIIELDKIAKNMGYELNDERRLDALTIYTIKTLTFNNGDTYLYFDEIYEGVLCDLSSFNARSGGDVFISIKNNTINYLTNKFINFS